MNALIVNSAESLQTTLGEIRERWNAAKYLRITIKEGKARSLPQNDIGHVWYAQIARELREDTALGVKCYCKLHHGVPILRSEDADFRAAYDSVIKPLSYEQKMEAMKFWPVTSLMNKGQKTAYLEAVQTDYGKRGVMLEFPEEQAA